jgi:ComF family protein
LGFNQLLKNLLMALQTTFPSFRELWNGFLHLMYPQLCVACGEDLPDGDSCFCLKCRLKIDVTDMHLVRDNEFTARLWGRVNIEAGAAMYYFKRKSPIQRALHQLKYNNQPEIGVKIGREFGRKLRNSEVFKSVEVVIPVPLHPKKERLRGYNQSAKFAEGIAETMELPVLSNVLVRESFTETQTRKKRMERFKNVGEVFAVKKPKAIEGKHLLLVDDVLTTGATLEMCGQALLAVPNTRLSLATIAIAMN